MKKLILIIMCVAIAMPLFSMKDDNKLYLSGYYVYASDVKLEVIVVKEGDRKTILQSKSSTFSYHITLKTGYNYIVRFIKEAKVKELYITADKPGISEIDVDFFTDDAARLCYNESVNNYNLTLHNER